MHSPHRKPSGRLRAAPRSGAALALSLAVNAAGLAALSAGGALDLLSADRATPVPVALAALPAARWEANRRVVPAETPPAAAPREVGAPEAAAPPPIPTGRIVDVAPSADGRRPEHARFLADRDGRVERETRSRFTGQGRWETAAPRPVAGAKGRGGVAESGDDGAGEESEPGRVGERAAAPAATPRSTAIPTATATATATDNATATPAGATTENTTAAPTATVSAARALLARLDGDGGLRRSGTWDPRLLPAGLRLDGPAAGGPSETVPPSVPEGEETRLNTRRFRFAEFYARVQAAIRREWDPNRAWDARDPHDRILGRRTRNATFDILLEPDGRLREVRLVGSSGLAFLDRECERAIRAAAPFPNPPAGLLGPDGEIALRGWVLSFDFAPRGALEALRR